jgi:hypothetical protein
MTNVDDIIDAGFTVHGAKLPLNVGRYLTHVAPVAPHCYLSTLSVEVIVEILEVSFVYDVECVE